MSLKNSFKKVKRFILKRYGDNLAAILVFGTANTGPFIEGKSDIDHFILLKKQKNLDFDKEIKFLIKVLKSENFATQYFHTLDNIKRRIKERSSWSTFITMVGKDGSKILYSTPEFKKFKKQLLKNPPSKKDIKEYLKRKDKFELDGYFNEAKGFRLTKALFSHLRRKLQVLNYFQNKKLIFNYNKCLNNINVSDSEKRKIKKLHKSYEDRRKLSKKEVDDYYDLAKKLTDEIIKK